MMCERLHEVFEDEEDHITVLKFTEYWDRRLQYNLKGMPQCYRSTGEGAINAACERWRASRERKKGGDTSAVPWRMRGGPLSIRKERKDSSGREGRHKRMVLTIQSNHNVEFIWRGWPQKKSHIPFCERQAMPMSMHKIYLIENGKLMKVTMGGQGTRKWNVSFYALQYLPGPMWRINWNVGRTWQQDQQPAMAMV